MVNIFAYAQNIQMRDPTMPYFEKQQEITLQADDLVLKAIFTNKENGRKTALINDVNASLNEETSLGKVLEINTNDVVLKTNDKEVKLFLISGIKKYE
jgi:hypothetical protein